MKRLLQFSVLTIVLLISTTSCEEDKWADWKLLNSKWFEIHKTDAGFQQTESGLCYKVIHQGLGQRVNSGSVIKAVYTGKLIDGTVFDSGTYYSSLSYAIAGWKEGIARMNVGGEYVFYVPSVLGYGEDGSGEIIGPGSTLIFTVKLLDPYN